MRPLLSLVLVAVAAACGLAASPPELTVTHRARALHPGEFVILSVDATTPIQSVTARAFDRNLAAFRGEAGWRVLLGLDIDVAPGRHDVTIEATAETGTARTTYPLTITAKDFPTRRLTVNPDFVNPPAAAQARIAEEAGLMARLWTAPPRALDSPDLRFVAPVPHRANSAFGTRSIFNGEPRGAHTGADFLSPAGTPVRAPASGVVVLARDLYYSGNAVIIDHGLGVHSVLAHLSRIDVRDGQTVDPGEVVGLVGRTGRVTGAHLHWTIRVGTARVDPLSLIALSPIPRD